MAIGCSHGFLPLPACKTALVIGATSNIGRAIDEAPPIGAASGDRYPAGQMETFTR
jgi:hypothetical protein